MIPSKHVLRMLREELRVYGDTERYRSLVALWNRTVTAEYAKNIPTSTETL